MKSKWTALQIAQHGEEIVAAVYNRTGEEGSFSLNLYTDVWTDKYQERKYAQSRTGRQMEGEMEGKMEKLKDGGSR